VNTQLMVGLIYLKHAIEQPLFCKLAG
jgi:hypothetical protein